MTASVTLADFHLTRRFASGMRSRECALAASSYASALAQYTITHDYIGTRKVHWLCNVQRPGEILQTANG